MKKKLLFLLTPMILLFMGLDAKASSYTISMEGTIGNYPATVVVTMTGGNKISGYYIFKGSKAPQTGKIKLSGTCRLTPPADMPTLPWYETKLTAKTQSGKVCGTWNVIFDTRSGSMEGECSINGKRYEVEVYEN